VDGTASSGDDFGWSVSIDGDTAIVGEPGANTDTGSAFVYVRSGGSWSQEKELTFSDAALGDQIGYSVAIDGDTAIVGAVGDDSFTGSVYFFDRDQGGTDNWGEVQKLTASDGASGDRFGESVSIDGDTALVGAHLDDDSFDDSGSAYVFVRSGTWGGQVKLNADDPAAYDWFGVSVSVSGDTALIGAEQGDGNVANSGSAYIFVRSGTWSKQQELMASDGVGGDKFGYSVSVDGDTALVGSVFDDPGGSTYAFIRSGSTWTQQDKLTASDTASGDAFGVSVSIDGDTALIGANGDDSNTGSAYVFVKARTSSDWAESIKILRPSY
jgi:hypothetical protein